MLRRVEQLVRPLSPGAARSPGTVTVLYIRAGGIWAGIGAERPQFGAPSLERGRRSAPAPTALAQRPPATPTAKSEHPVQASVRTYLYCPTPLPNSTRHRRRSSLEGRKAAGPGGAPESTGPNASEAPEPAGGALRHSTSVCGRQSRGALPGRQARWAGVPSLAAAVAVTFNCNIDQRYACLSWLDGNARGLLEFCSGSNGPATPRGPE